MPLSEHEQKLLEQLEQQLNADDPRFASSMAADEARPVTRFSLRNVVLGILVVLVGLGIIIAGVSTKLILLGVLGFVVAAAGVYFATVHRGSGTISAKDSAKSAAGKRKPQNTSNFMRGLEDKWDERRNRGL